MMWNASEACVDDTDCPNPAARCYSNTSWAPVWFSSNADVDKYAVGQSGCACAAFYGFVKVDGECTGLSAYSISVAALFAALAVVESVLLIRSFQRLCVALRKKNARKKWVLGLLFRQTISLLVGAFLSIFLLLEHLLPTEFSSNHGTSLYSSQTVSSMNGILGWLLSVSISSVVVLLVYYMGFWLRTVTRVAGVARSSSLGAISELGDHLAHVNSVVRITRYLEWGYLVFAFLVTTLLSQTWLISLSAPYVVVAVLLMKYSAHLFQQTLKVLKFVDDDTNVINSKHIPTFSNLDFLKNRSAALQNRVLVVLGYFALVFCARFALADSKSSNREYHVPGKLPWFALTATALKIGLTLLEYVEDSYAASMWENFSKVNASQKSRPKNSAQVLPNVLGIASPSAKRNPLE